MLNLFVNHCRHLLILKFTLFESHLHCLKLKFVCLRTLVVQRPGRDQISVETEQAWATGGQYKTRSRGIPPSAECSTLAKLYVSAAPDYTPILQNDGSFHDVLVMYLWRPLITKILCPYMAMASAVFVGSSIGTLKIAVEKNPSNTH